MTATKAKEYVDLIPLAEPRKCDKCGEPTLWAAPRQTKNGRCLPCHPGYWREASEAQVLDAIFALVDAFGPVEIHEPNPDAGYIDADAFQPQAVMITVTMRWATDIYYYGEDQAPAQRFVMELADPNLGPCARCFRTIVRYGPRARSHCLACHRHLERERSGESVADEFAELVKRAGL